MFKIIRGLEEINSNGGFSFIKRLLDSNAGMSKWDETLGAKPNASHSTSGIVRAMVGLMTAGECDYAAIDKYHDDFLLQSLVGGELPAEATFRQRLDALALRLWQPVPDDCVARLLADASEAQRIVK